jgi:hypothetical protein
MVRAAPEGSRYVYFRLTLDVESPISAPASRYSQLTLTLEMKNRRFSKKSGNLFQLYTLASHLQIDLKDSDIDSTLQNFQIEDELTHRFLSGLYDSGIKVVVLDESQKQIDYITFLVKHNCDAINNGLVTFIVSGTPPVGKDTVDYSGSAMSRGGSYIMRSFDPYQVRSILNLIFGKEVSSKIWLDIWTLFNGEPSLYQEFYRLWKNQDIVTTENMAQHGITDKVDLLKCWNIFRDNFSSCISMDVMDVVNIVKRPLDSGYEKEIRQLVSRDVLNFAVTISDFLGPNFNKKSILICKDILAEKNCRLTDMNFSQFSRLRGFASSRVHSKLKIFSKPSELMLLINNINSDGLEKIFNFECTRLEANPRNLEN